MRTLLKRCLALLMMLSAAFPSAQASEPDAVRPVRVAIVGLTHDHAFWLLGRPRDRGDIRIVSVYEPNEDLARRRMEAFRLDPDLHYTDLSKLLVETKPEAVCLFGSIREHHEQTLRCIEACAHVMVEKPLAVSLAHAEEMAAAARRAGVHLMTNYETTWYANHAELRRRFDRGDFGAIRRLTFRTGHRGPIEIGCRPEFVAWLLDPVENGGGASTDFGCYGANLTTWLMDGQAPAAVSAVIGNRKPDKYPRVDDDATITLEYPGAVAVIQASWNWPHNIKETRVFAEGGDWLTLEADRLRVHPTGQEAETLACPPLAATADDPFAHLAEVVRGKAEPNALSSLDNNLTVVRILDAARRSAESGQRVVLEAR